MILVVLEKLIAPNLYRPRTRAGTTSTRCQSRPLTAAGPSSESATAGTGSRSEHVQRSDPDAGPARAWPKLCTVKQTRCVSIPSRWWISNNSTGTSAVLPVVTVDDLRPLAGLEHELQRRPAQEREPADVIGGPGQLAALKERVGGVGSIKKHFRVTAEDLRPRSAYFIDLEGGRMRSAWQTACMRTRARDGLGTRVADLRLGSRPRRRLPTATARANSVTWTNISTQSVKRPTGSWVLQGMAIGGSDDG